MRILITGGAGFIGSHLAETILSGGDEVCIIDDLSTGSRENIVSLRQNQNFRDHIVFHVDTILNRELIRETVARCDRVFHFAAAVGVRCVMGNPLSTIKVNIEGTENVLNSCAEFGRKILITSTSEVYGKHTHAPLLETDNVIYGPSEKSRWSYATTKLINEIMALEFARTRSLEVIVTRPFNIVGPRQAGAYGMVVPRLIGKALKNEPLTVYGDGSQSRAFMHVEDAVRSMIALMDNSASCGQIFNIGREEEITILELAKKIIKITGSGSRIEFVPYENVFENTFEDIQRRVPGIDKLKEYIGVTPGRDLDTILRETALFMKSKL